MIINGKGIIILEPTVPLGNDAVYIEESVKVQTYLNKTDKEKKEKRKIVTVVESSKPSSVNDVIPAQCAIILENRDVLLTAYLQLIVIIVMLILRQNAKFTRVFLTSHKINLARLKSQAQSSSF